jgi:hypothetical protein
LPQSKAIFAALLLATATLAACSSGSGPRGVLPRDRDAVDRMSTAYVRGVELQNAGKCEEAVKLLERAAAQGPGYEDAQRRLGECLITLSNGGGEQYSQGIVWLKRAAEASWPEAQGALAFEYATGPQADPVEAAKWLVLYERNPRLKRIGFTPLPAGRLARIRAAIPAEAMNRGRAAADAFVPVVWQPPPSEREKDGKEPGERANRTPPIDDPGRPVGGEFPQPSE